MVDFAKGRQRSIPPFASRSGSLTYNIFRFMRGPLRTPRECAVAAPGEQRRPELGPGPVGRVERGNDVWHAVASEVVDDDVARMLADRVRCRPTERTAAIPVDGDGPGSSIRHDGVKVEVAVQVSKRDVHGTSAGGEEDGEREFEGRQRLASTRLAGSERENGSRCEREGRSAVSNGHDYLLLEAAGLNTPAPASIGILDEHAC